MYPGILKFRFGFFFSFSSRSHRRIFFFFLFFSLFNLLDGLTWCDEVRSHPVHGDLPLPPVPPEGRLVPGTVVDAPRRDPDFDGTRSQVQVEEHVTFEQFETEKIRLESRESKRKKNEARSINHSGLMGLTHLGCNVIMNCRSCNPWTRGLLGFEQNQEK